MLWNEHIETLVLKQLNGEASPLEQVELQQWLDADPEHRDLYGDCIKIWQQSGLSLQSLSFNTVRAWQKMDADLQGSLPYKETAYRGILRQIGLSGRKKAFLAAAALLLVLLVPSWLFYRHTTQSRGQLLVAEKTDRSISLPDGSLVYLRQGSSLQFGGSFGREERMVDLQGEAFFETAPAPDKPFVVRTHSALIADLGTSFQVKEEKDLDEVVVVSGKVKFTDKARSGRNIILLAGQKAILKEDGFFRSDIDDSNFMAWKTGVLDFKGTPLDKAARELEDVYKIAISFSPPLQADAASIRVTARFERQSLNEVLDEIRLTTGLRTKMEKDSLTFYRP